MGGAWEVNHTKLLGIRLRDTFRLTSFARNVSFETLYGGLFTLSTLSVVNSDSSGPKITHHLRNKVKK